MISVAFWHAFHAIRDNTVPGYPNHNRSAFDGAAVQVAYQFRERGEHAFDPGFSVGIETRYAKFSEGTAFSADRYSVAIKGAIDMALSGDRLYGAFNFSLGPGTERVRLTPGYVADSALELSLAATYRLTHGGNTFIGVNARYAASFSNAFYGRWSGHAVLAGPTLYHEFGTVGPLQYVFLSVAWTPQIWGGPPEASRAITTSSMPSDSSFACVSAECCKSRQAIRLDGYCIRSACRTVTTR